MIYANSILILRLGFAFPVSFTFHLWLRLHMYTQIIQNKSPRLVFLREKACTEWPIQKFKQRRKETAVRTLGRQGVLEHASIAQGRGWEGQWIGTGIGRVREGGGGRDLCLSHAQSPPALPSPCCVPAQLLLGMENASQNPNAAGTPPGETDSLSKP